MTKIAFNPFYYPGWRTPGIDGAHPASRNLCFSGLVNWNNYYDLRTGVVGARSGSTTNGRIIFPIGPVCESTGFFGNMESVFPAARPIALGDPFTFAGFVMTTNTPGYAACLFSNGAGGNTYGACFSVNGGSWSCSLNGAVSLGGSNTVFVQGRPFFWACSFFGGAGRIVTRDLWSGEFRFENFGWDGNSFKHQPGVGGASCMTQGGVSIQGYYGPEMWSATFLTMNELTQWSADPWSFWFPPKIARRPTGPSGIVVQMLRPDTDDSISDWTDQAGGTTTIFNAIDEASASDTDYIRSPTPPNSSVARFRLSDPTAGKTLDQPVVVSYRFKKTSADGLGLVVSLKQSMTLIASWTHIGSGLTTTFQTVEQTLSGGQFAAITDFNDLFIEFQAAPAFGFEAYNTDERGLADQPPVVANIQTFTNVNFGNEDANRQAVIAWSYLPAAGGAVDLPSFKVDGITATRVDVANLSNGVAIYRVALPTGSGPIHTCTLDYSGLQGPQAGFINCYAVYNSTTETHSSTTAQIYNPSATFDFPNYIVIAAAAADFNVSGATVNNMTINHNETYAGIVQYVSASNFAASGNMTFTVNWNASPNTASAAVFVAFQP